jgi:hypothetical protein
LGHFKCPYFFGKEETYEGRILERQRNRIKNTGYDKRRTRSRKGRWVYDIC